MFNYNVANPINIHYRKYPNQNKDAQRGVLEEQKTSGQIPSATEENGGQKKFPNGNKVAIDYTKNQINISQVLQDFRSTIAAINSPDDVKEEVEIYLELVEKEAKKGSPSREIVLSNLKNAARVTDKYIQDSLKKPSKVVQDWVEALFLQKINLKADPNEVNEEFKIKIPPKKTASEHSGGLAPLNKDTVSFNTQKTASKETETITVQTFEPQAVPPVYNANSATEAQIIEEKAPETIPPQAVTNVSAQIKTTSPYEAKTENEALAKELLKQGIASFKNGEDAYSTLKLYDEALEHMEGSTNSALKSAIYYERAKVFDEYDYAELALIDYNKATKSSDYNLKTQAHIKMGNIYDDYVQIEPAADQYSRAIETSEEIGNLQGKTKALRCMATMFSKLYDTENAQAFSELALESADQTGNPKIISKTYLEVANNYKYMGENSKALHVYGTLAQNETVKDDYETMAQNYMEASALMDKKGNKKKSYALMLKAKEYQRLAKLKRMDSAS